MCGTSDSAYTIMVVGDWVVDEYWFLVRHHSEISSHTGFVHYRISSKQGETVRDLCGAGHVAKVFFQLGRGGNCFYRLVGLGNWNDEDTQFISHLVHAREEEGSSCTASSALFRLMPSWCDDLPEDVTLISLRPDSPTIRVIRQYHQQDVGLDQINRVDWEPQRVMHSARVNHSVWKTLESLNVNSVVVQDLAKGVVTEDLVRRLRAQYPDANWYVRSKLGEPNWLKLVEDSLELLVLGPEVVALLNPWENWLAGGKMTIQALETIERLPGKNVVLLSDQREVITRLNESTDCITGQSLVRPTPVTQLGWPSAFLASLVHVMHDKKSDLEREDIVKALSLADNNCGVPVPGSGRQKTRQSEQLEPIVRCSSWIEELASWKQARENYGIIQDENGQLQLDVWRGSTFLPGYIVCVEKKLDVLNRVGRHLRGFKRKEARARSLSIMLQADPGAGKTFLAKSLARAFDFSFIRFDVTQMIHRDDLLDLFDAVATLQANTDSEILVFVDEINALLDGSHVFGAFLSPLEEGFYVRRGNVFSLKPAVWIFAGTKLDRDDLETGEKLSDFKSRMTLIERIDFVSMKPLYRDTARLQNEARLEQVYLGATMIKKSFPDVYEVSKEVLEQFHKLDPEGAPARKIRKLAASLRNVQYGRVTRENCRDWEGCEWSESEDGKTFVKLVFA